MVKRLLLLVVVFSLQACLSLNDETESQHGIHALSGEWNVVEKQPVSYEFGGGSTTVDEHPGKIVFFDDYTVNIEFWDWDPVEFGSDFKYERDYEDDLISEGRISKWRINEDTLAIDLTAEFETRMEVPEEHKPIEQRYIYQLKNDTLSLFRVGRSLEAKEFAGVSENNYHYVRE